MKSTLLQSFHTMDNEHGQHQIARGMKFTLFYFAVCNCGELIYAASAELLQLAQRNEH